MKIIKRSGSEVDFNREKIVIAVTKANESVVPSHRLTPIQIKRIAEDVESAAANMQRALSVEEIQDMVEDQIMNQRAFAVARSYITYRYKRAMVRKSNTTDEQILSLIECNNEEVKQENSNKNPTVNSVQRDYMAGEVSKDITKRILLPSDIVAAHEDGRIHFHDADYFAQRMHNCDLVNLEDMLQNGTVISETLIKKPIPSPPPATSPPRSLRRWRPVSTADRASALPILHPSWSSAVSASVRRCGRSCPCCREPSARSKSTPLPKSG